MGDDLIYEFLPNRDIILLYNGSVPVIFFKYDPRGATSLKQAYGFVINSSYKVFKYLKNVDIAQSKIN